MLEKRFDCFVKRVLKNALRDIKREEARRREREVLFCEMSPGQINELSTFDKYSADESFDFLYTAISKLKQKHRDIISLIFFESLTERGVAAVLSMPKSTVHYNLAVALKKLKDILGAEK
jgi:RNA polymerase sigma factor (sigma-70 family)